MSLKIIDNVHVFAFYTPFVTHLAEKKVHLDIHEITDPELIHRMITVLRLQKGERVILFDRSFHVNATLLGIYSKKSVTIEVHTLEPNVVLEPSITWLLPLLKREAFEEALYSLTELGAQAIQPIATHKTHRVWGGEKEVMRCQKIVISAAEQSKNYAFPQLLPIMSLDMWLINAQHIPATKIFFDASGVPFSTIMATLTIKTPIIACVGPEGDLTTQEKEQLRAQGFLFSRLTPTVLRAQQAVTVGLGVLRSLICCN